MNMQDVLKTYEIPLSRHFEQIALALESAGAGDPITELKLYYAPGLSITWRKGDPPRIEGDRVTTPEHLRGGVHRAPKTTIRVPERRTP